MTFSWEGVSFLNWGFYTPFPLGGGVKISLMEIELKLVIRGGKKLTILKSCTLCT